MENQELIDSILCRVEFEAFWRGGHVLSSVKLGSDSSTMLFSTACVECGHCGVLMVYPKESKGGAYIHTGPVSVFGCIPQPLIPRLDLGGLELGIH